jgi:mono/diheme cytochrome c family protein
MTTARVTVRHPPRSTQAAYCSLILAAAAAAFAWASCARAQQAAGAVAEAAKGSEGNAANGKQLYVTIGCAYCHGTEGQGGGGPRRAELTAQAAREEELRLQAQRAAEAEAAHVAAEEAEKMTQLLAEQFPCHRGRRRSSAKSH